MKFVILSILASAICNLLAAEPRIVPATPSLEDLAKRAADAVIVLVCEPNVKATSLEVFEVLKGGKEYSDAKDKIAALIHAGDSQTLLTKDYKVLVFIGPVNDRGVFTRCRSVALWPQHDETLADGRTIRFLAHDYTAMKRALQGANKKAQQAGAGQPATRPESKSEGMDKPQPKSEGRSR